MTILKTAARETKVRRAEKNFFGDRPHLISKPGSGTDCCLAFSFVVVVLFYMFFTPFLNSFWIQHKILENCLPASNNKTSKTVMRYLKDQKP